MRKLLVLTTLVLAACGGDAKRTAAETETMERGLTHLRAGEFAAAEQQFRDLLQRNPAHYGARFQLAVALDRGGKPADARMVWMDVQRSAEQANDSATLATARTRLAAPDTLSTEQVMQTGLDMLYKQSNPSGAALLFRQILQRNPTHYGATFQLATALDRADKRAEARPLWEKTLGMAVSYKDQATIDAARVRLRARD